MFCRREDERVFVTGVKMDSVQKFLGANKDYTGVNNASS